MKYLAVLYIAFILLLPNSAHAQRPDEVTLSTHNLCPYGCYNDIDFFDGYAVRVVRYAFNRMEIPLKIKVVPWSRAQYMAETGLSDGFFAASRNADRDSTGVMSTPVAEQKWTWYLLNNSPLDPAADDFKQAATVSSFHGANMLKWLQENGYNVFAPPTDTEALARMLLANRFDAILANNLVMDEIIRRDGLKSKLKSHTLKNKPLGVYFSNRFVKENPGFVDEFNKFVLEYRSRYEEQ